MLTIKGIYDGKSIHPLEKLPENKRCKVFITFIEEIDEDTDVREFGAQSNAFKFWENTSEDLYQDFLPNKK